MRYRKLTDTGDYSFGGNAEDYISDTSAVAQAIKTKVLLFYGEWWEDTGIGIPVFQSVIGQRNSSAVQNAFRSLLAKRIKEIPEVKTISDVEIETEGRNIKVYVKCTTKSNETAETEVVI